MTLTPRSLSSVGAGGVVTLAFGNVAVMGDAMRGMQGYAEQADGLVERYEAVGFHDKHQAVLHLIPSAPSPWTHLAFAAA
jgi:hypothetical protein